MNSSAAGQKAASAGKHQGLQRDVRRGCVEAVPGLGLEPLSIMVPSLGPKATVLTTLHKVSMTL